MKSVQDRTRMITKAGDIPKSCAFEEVLQMKNKPPHCRARFYLQAGCIQYPAETAHPRIAPCVTPRPSASRKQPFPKFSRLSTDNHDAIIGLRLERRERRREGSEPAGEHEMARPGRTQYSVHICRMRANMLRGIY